MNEGRLARFDAALAGIRAKLDERATLRARLNEALAATEGLRAQLAIPAWAELESSAAIAVGDVVRYLGREYRCVRAHSKSLTRRPTDKGYWEEAEA